MRKTPSQGLRQSISSWNLLATYHAEYPFASLTIQGNPNLGVNAFIRKVHKVPKYEDKLPVIIAAVYQSRQRCIARRLGSGIILDVLERLVPLRRDGEPPCGGPRTTRASRTEDKRVWEPWGHLARLPAHTCGAADHAGVGLALSASPAASALAGHGYVFHKRGDRAVGIQREVGNDLQGEVRRCPLADEHEGFEDGCLLLENNLLIRIDPAVDECLTLVVPDVYVALVVRAGDV